MRIRSNIVFSGPFAVVVMRLVVSSILNSRKVGAKLLARGGLY
jgi:hypothetical protein